MRARRTGKHRDAETARRAARTLAVQFALMIAGIVAMVTVIAFVVVISSQARATEQALDTSRDDIRGDELPHGTLVIREHDGHLTSSSELPPGLPDEAAFEEVRDGAERVDSTVPSGSTRYVVRTSRGEDGIVQVAIDNHENTEQRTRVGIALGVGGLAGVLIAALAANRLARRAMRPLAESLAQQRRFVADASHELRTPLTLLSTRVQILRRRSQATSDPRLDAEIAAVQEDTQALTRLLEELLESADDREVAKEAVVLGPLVSEAVESARAEAEAENISLGLDLEEDVQVLATPVAIRRIVQALLSNALDHTRSRVDLTLTTVRRTATLRVADDGDGFPTGVDMFERFASQRSAGEARHHYGLGLALVADIVHRMDGVVRIVPATTGGVVEVTLPCVPKEALER